MCGTTVKLENVERHVRDQHPHSTIELGTVMNEAERDAVRRSRLAARPAVSRRGIGIASAVAIVLAILIVLLAFNPFGNVGPNVGQLAPDFTLTQSTGGTFTLSSYRGSVVLVEFMDVDCEFCQQEAPTLASVYSTHASLGVRFVSVDIDFLAASDTADRINAFKQQYGTDWVYVLDSSKSAMRAYGVDSTPTTFILKGDGVIARIFGSAGVSAETYRAALDAALGS